MIALDTNVLVRCLTLDDASQVPAAQTLLGHANGVFISKTASCAVPTCGHVPHPVPSLPSSAFASGQPGCSKSARTGDRIHVA